MPTKRLPTFEAKFSKDADPRPQRPVAPPRRLVLRPRRAALAARAEELLESKVAEAQGIGAQLAQATAALAAARAAPRRRGDGDHWGRATVLCES